MKPKLLKNVCKMNNFVHLWRNANIIWLCVHGVSSAACSDTLYILCSVVVVCLFICTALSLFAFALPSWWINIYICICICLSTATFKRITQHIVIFIIHTFSPFSAVVLPGSGVRGTKLQENYMSHVKWPKVIQWTNTFGEATAQSRCQILCSSKVNWKKLNCWKSRAPHAPVPHSWRRQHFNVFQKCQ